MHRGQPAHDGVIADLHMPGERSVIRKNYPVAHVAIVTDVAVSQKIPAIADARFSFARCAAIDRDEFAKRIFVADLQISRLALVF